MKVVVLVALSAAAVLGQAPPDCEETFKCIVGLVKSNGPSSAERAEMKAAFMAAKEKVKAEISKCFVDNSCEDPIPKAEAMKACLKRDLKEALKQAAPEIIGCLAEQLGKPNRRGRAPPVPKELLAKLKALAEGGPPAGPPPALVQFVKGQMAGGDGMPEMDDLKKQIGRRLRKAANEACPNRKAAREVKKCLKDKMQGLAEKLPAPAEDGPAPPNPLAIMAQCRPPPQCLRAMGAVKRAACKCAKDFGKDEEAKAALAGVVQDCKQEAGITGELTKQEKNMIKKKLKMIKSKVCQRPKFGGFRGGQN